MKLPVVHLGLEVDLLEVLEPECGGLRQSLGGQTTHFHLTLQRHRLRVRRLEEMSPEVWGRIGSCQHCEN